MYGSAGGLEPKSSGDDTSAATRPAPIIWGILARGGCRRWRWRRWQRARGQLRCTHRSGPPLEWDVLSQHTAPATTEAKVSHLGSHILWGLSEFHATCSGGRRHVLRVLIVRAVAHNQPQVTQGGPGPPPCCRRPSTTDLGRARCSIDTVGRQQAATGGSRRTRPLWHFGGGFLPRPV